MKENKYDDELFFEQYSNFPRSAEGLAAAGEWHELRKMLPDFQGKRVLDLGCGFGWHCKYAVEHGAVSALGTDLSEKMLKGALERNPDPRITYEKTAMEDISYPADSFDIVLSSLAFHYVEDFPMVCKKIYNCLVKGGAFVFSCEHPVFTAYGTQDWHCDEDGKILHWPVDRYFTEGKREAHFLGCDVVKYHKTLTTYVNTLLQTGFAITGLAEPQPDPELLDVPGMKDELRRPMMLLVSAEKR
ncbi:class I SAM-dependent methyltransferase [Candidatus Soleaferrea massiliensis]|uniref:class I SAM-dependent methyltransferase n=1 Tax=Candidatus Soleaferrea massiliensis TaxID=1470354 RepID=UPI00058DC389|nr:class I SAM-dependent methyltransferase [Candidatus Soleaferrea massiliensis]